MANFDLLIEAERLHQQADALEARAQASEKFEDLLDQYEDALLFVRRKLGAAVYTYAAVRYQDHGGADRWAVTGRGQQVGMTTDDMVVFMAKATEVWIATELERIV